jgi:hypothetical protein
VRAIGKKPELLQHKAKKFITATQEVAPLCFNNLNVLVILKFAKLLASIQ